MKKKGITKYCNTFGQAKKFNMTKMETGKKTKIGKSNSMND